MPVDPRIALQLKPLEVPSPMESAAKVYSLRNLINQGDLQKLQVEQATLSAKKRQALTEAVANMTAEQANDSAFIRKLMLEHAEPADLAKYLAEERAASKGQSIGAGGLRLPGGEIIPPAARPQSLRELLPSQRRRERVQGDQLIQEELQNDGTWTQIGTGPRFARQVAPSVVVQRPDSPVQTFTDNQNRLWERERGGKWRLAQMEGGSGAPLTARPPPGAMKVEQARRQTMLDISRAITELEAATKDGGLIDKSTGSGAGALVDAAGRFVGYSTPGSIAAGDMGPIFDLVLKMVPRFEGPQSDKDTASYERAAGQLANPAIPNAQKKSAGKEILRLMKARKAQFISKDMVGTEAEGSGPKFLGFE